MVAKVVAAATKTLFWQPSSCRRRPRLVPRLVRNLPWRRRLPWWRVSHDSPGQNLSCRGVGCGSAEVAPSQATAVAVTAAGEAVAAAARLGAAPAEALSAEAEVVGGDATAQVLAALAKFVATAALVMGVATEAGVAALQRLRTLP